MLMCRAVGFIFRALIPAECQPMHPYLVTVRDQQVPWGDVALLVPVEPTV